MPVTRQNGCRSCCRRCQRVSPSYIHYLDTIEELERRGVRVKVSDISDALNLPRPGVTRTVKEMEDKGYLKKSHRSRMAA